jgi:GNAT superfamily N-acetyltransferase
MRRNERRRAQAVADLADEHPSIGSGVMAYMKGTAWMCKAVAADREQPLTDDDLESTTDCYRSRGRPPPLEVTAYSREETLAAAARADFFLIEAEHVLSRSPADLGFPPPVGRGHRAPEPNGRGGHARHAEIVCSGFAPPDGVVPEPVVESSIRSQRHPNAMGFFACLTSGECVAASGMEISTIGPGAGESPAKVLAPWGTTVLPAHRRRGIPQALIAHRLGIGLEQGGEIAIIESKPGISTERNAARLGFLPTYTRLLLRASP